jgi:hypothetical protein
MIKKILFIFLLLASTLVAETKVEYQISFIGMSMDYREYDNSGVILDSERSSYSDVSGVEFAYRFFLDRNAYIDLKAMGVAGYSDYVGAYIDSDAGYGSVKSKTFNTIKDFSLAYNAKNMSDMNLMMLGGIGFGYRYWQRELSTTQIELYEWYSFRINAGMEFKYKNLTSSLIIEYQYGLNPTMSATGIDEDFELSSANIVKISLPLRYVVNKNLDLSCEYAFEYQKIEESDVVYDGGVDAYVEPDSKAYNQYLKVGIVFKY